MANLEALILRNTRANQPAAGIAGRLYYVTDESVMERDNGAAWQSVEGSGGAVNFTNLGDVPAAYTGQGGKVVAVKADVSGLEFVAGGGGLSWNQVLNASGASFVGWTGVTGTWSSDGTVIKQTNTGATASYARYDTLCVPGLIIMEAEIQLRTSGIDRVGGLMVGWDGSGNGAAGARIAEDDKVHVETVFTTAKLTKTQTININTWYKLRIVVSSGVLSVYLDGVLLGSGGNNIQTNINASYIGLYTYLAEVWFRNIKAWNLTMPA